MRVDLRDTLVAAMNTQSNLGSIDSAAARATGSFRALFASLTDGGTDAEQADARSSSTTPEGEATDEAPAADSEEPEAIQRPDEAHDARSTPRAKPRADSADARATVASAAATFDDAGPAGRSDDMPAPRAERTAKAKDWPEFGQATHSAASVDPFVTREASAFQADPSQAVADPASRPIALSSTFHGSVAQVRAAFRTNAPGHTPEPFSQATDRPRAGVARSTPEARSQPKALLSALPGPAADSAEAAVPPVETAFAARVPYRESHAIPADAVIPQLPADSPSLIQAVADGSAVPAGPAPQSRATPAVPVPTTALADPTEIATGPVTSDTIDATPPDHYRDSDMGLPTAAEPERAAVSVPKRLSAAVNPRNRADPLRAQSDVEPKAATIQAIALHGISDVPLGATEPVAHIDRTNIESTRPTAVLPSAPEAEGYRLEPVLHHAARRGAATAADASPVHITAASTPADQTPEPHARNRTTARPESISGDAESIRPSDGRLTTSPSSERRPELGQTKARIPESATDIAPFRNDVNRGLATSARPPLLRPLATEVQPAQKSLPKISIDSGPAVERATPFEGTRPESTEAVGILRRAPAAAADRLPGPIAEAATRPRQAGIRPVFATGPATALAPQTARPDEAPLSTPMVDLSPHRSEPRPLVPAQLLLADSPAPQSVQRTLLTVEPDAAERADPGGKSDPRTTVTDSRAAPRTADTRQPTATLVNPAMSAIPTSPFVDPVAAEATRSDEGLQIAEIQPASRTAAGSDPVSIPAQAASQARAAHVVQQLTPAMKILPDGIAEVSLSPQELGHVRMAMRVDGDAVVVHIVAERPDTLDLLQRHTGQLAAALRDAGFSDVSYAFSQDGRRAPQGQANTPGATFTAVQAEAPQPSTPSPQPLPGDRLDLRL